MHYCVPSLMKMASSLGNILCSAFQTSMDFDSNTLTRTAHGKAQAFIASLAIALWIKSAFIHSRAIKTSLSACLSLR